MTTGEVLRQGFAAAHCRLRFVLLDVLWKGIWLTATLAGAFLAAGWFGSQFRSIEWQGPGIRGVNGLLIAALLRQLWNVYAEAIFWSTVLIFVFSCLVWLLLESFFRAQMMRLVSDAEEENGVTLRTTSPFGLFFVSGLARWLILAAASTILGLIAFGGYLRTPFGEWPDVWLEARAVAAAGFVALLAFTFLLTVLLTLLRSDAIDLLGTDLIRVSGVIGTLLLFEASICVSLLIVGVAGVFNAGGSAEAKTMLAAVAFTVVALSVLHSYLLLVRFCAVAIMRRNVGNV